MGIKARNPAQGDGWGDSGKPEVSRKHSLCTVAVWDQEGLPRGMVSEGGNARKKERGRKKREQAKCFPAMSRLAQSQFRDKS